MRKPNKIICFLILLAFLFNIFVSDAYACWWKSVAAGNGSPDISGAPNKQQGNNTGLTNQATFAEPIYLHNGDFVYEFQDLFIPSRGMPLEIKHTYKSQSLYNNRFGACWDLNYNQRVVALANGDAYYYNGANMRTHFTYLDGKKYVSPPETYDKLAQNTDGTWTLTKKHGEKYYFNQNGMISKIEDRNNNAITFTYGLVQVKIIGVLFFCRYRLTDPPTTVIANDWALIKITDTVGRDVTFDYDENGRVKALTDFSGRTVKYSYDMYGNLSSVTKPATTDFPDGTTTNFTYAKMDNQKLISIADAKGQVFLKNSYNGQGMVDSQEYGGDKVYINYDLDNKTTETKDAKGFRAVYTFNDSGNPLTKKQFTAGLRTGVSAYYVMSYQYNNHLELTKALYPKGNTILYTYDEMGNLLSQTRTAVAGSTHASIVTTATYEPRYNFVKTQVDPKGNTTTYYYDYEEKTLGDLNGDGVTDQDKGNLVKISLPAVNGVSSEIKYTYNSNGQPQTITDPNNNITKYEYDTSTGYVAKVINNYGGLNITTEMTYDAVGNVKTIKDPKGNISGFEYDSHNNLIKTTSSAPFNYVTNYKYDVNDKLIQKDVQTGVSAQPWQTTYYTYDILDRLISVNDPLGNTTTFGYDANGNRNLITDAEGHSTSYEFDERNLLWKATDALNNTTKYDYDPNANLTAIIDSKGNSTKYTYADFDIVTKTTYANGSSETYSYDDDLNLTSKTDPKNQAITYDYDALNRLNLKTYPDKSTISYSYDKASRLTDAVDSNGTIHYDYDVLNRTTKVTYPGSKSVSYEYDANSNRAKLIYPDSSYITYQYDQLNRLTAINGADGKAIAQYGYDVLSRRTQLDYANNTQATYTYDAANRLLNMNNKVKAGADISNYAYTYDKVANRKTMTTSVGTHTYAYDANYQLAIANYPAGYFTPNTPFTYDKLGNRTVSQGVTYTSNNLNQYTQAGTTNYTYDANGNLTSDATNTYSYDSENRLVVGTVPDRGLSLTYTYDAFGRRITKTVNGVTTKFLYDGDQIIAEYDGSNNMTAKYVYGTGIDEVLKGLSPQGTVPEWYYHYDGLGSVTAITNSSGAVIESYSYDAFGKPSATSTVGNRFMFTGREYDPETSLYYFRARYYDPKLGRFLQRDPLNYIAGINLYIYCYNNPVNWIDPSGLKVYIGGRGIFGVGGHTVIILVPDNQEDFINDPRFKINPITGKREADISAGPVGNWGAPLLTPYPYDTDRMTNPGMKVKPIKDCQGRSDTQLIKDILDSAAQYANDLTYDPFALGGCYNSNSYVRGILKASGINNPPLPDKRFYPGWTKPIPLNNN